MKVILRQGDRKCLRLFYSMSLQRRLGNVSAWLAFDMFLMTTPLKQLFLGIFDRKGFLHILWAV